MPHRRQSILDARFSRAPETEATSSEPRSCGEQTTPPPIGRQSPRPDQEVPGDRAERGGTTLPRAIEATRPCEERRRPPLFQGRQHLAAQGAVVLPVAPSLPASANREHAQLRGRHSHRTPSLRSRSARPATPAPPALLRNGPAGLRRWPSYAPLLCSRQNWGTHDPETEVVAGDRREVDDADRGPAGAGVAAPAAAAADPVGAAGTKNIRICD